MDFAQLSEDDTIALQPRRRFGRLEAALWLCAAVSLGLVLWMQADAFLYQRRARALLAAEEAADLVRPAAARASAASGAPRIGAPLARIAIPRLDLSAVVAEGVTDRVLQRAVGHVPGTARPGQPGNIGLAGHRDTFFRGLGDLRVGDRIYLENASGRRDYRVEWSAIVYPRATDVLTDPGYPVLTLVTCYPFNYLGAAPYRFVVRAREVGRR